MMHRGDEPKGICSTKSTRGLYRFFILFSAVRMVATLRSHMLIQDAILKNMIDTGDNNLPLVIQSRL